MPQMRSNTTVIRDQSGCTDIRSISASSSAVKEMFRRALILSRTCAGRETPISTLVMT